MDKKKFPREGAKGEDELTRRDDVEGHGPRRIDDFNRTGPGTGGDAFPRRPSSGGELIDDNDVEGHGSGSGDGLNRTGPGTGGDAFPRRPSSGGELIDDNDVEGHRLI
jgi:hypothetical protein